jgi:plastocyanin
MTRIHLLSASAAAVALVAAVPTAAAPTATKLTGTVGPSFTISLTKAGTKVTKLKAGSYTFAIKDKSNFHNFHLTGPGVNKKTTVAAVVNKTWTVTLKKGTYKYVCDPHKTQMKGSFTVT